MISDCPNSGIGTQVLTYTCSATGGGITAGTPIQQFYSGVTGAITETATYNANGPITAIPAIPAATPSTGNCTVPTGTPGNSTCGVGTAAEVVPTGTLVLTAAAGAGETVQITNAPSSAGDCPLSSVLPTAISAPAGTASVTYTCSDTQSIPNTTAVTGVTVATNGTAAVPQFTASANANAPLPGVAAVPQPQTLTISGATGAPTITGVTPQSGPPGTSVTISGTNLSAASAANFGVTPGVSLFCTPAGTSCQVLVPAIVAATVPLVVLTPGGQSNAVGFTVTSGVSPSPVPGGVTISTSPGWNLVGGPTGTTVNGNSGALYTYQAADTTYESLSVGTPLQGSLGYWAYFNTPGSLSLPPVGPQSQTVSLPAGHWVMIGNPGTSPVTVTGADIVYTYNASITTGSPYTSTTTLQPGQGAWAISNNGGTATIR